MSDFINVSICVTDIPREKIKMADSGKKYISVCVAKLRSTDSYGNTHCVFMAQSKEEREAKQPRAYIGHGKGVEFRAETPSAEQIERMPSAGYDDDIPF